MPEASKRTAPASLAHAQLVLEEKLREDARSIPLAALVRRYKLGLPMAGLALVLGVLIGFYGPRINLRQGILAAECPPCPVGQTCSKGICVKAAAQVAESCSQTIEQLILEIHP